MARIRTKIGDVFSVKLDGIKKYFQYIANDLTQLNSDVIRTFKTPYSIDANPELSLIINDEVDFYAHCVINLGVKLHLWEKVGYDPNVGHLDVLFRSSNDYGVAPGGQPVAISKNWKIWKIGKDVEQVGKLQGENQKAEIGVVVNPYDIVERLRTGKYDFVYPGF